MTAIIRTLSRTITRLIAAASIVFLTACGGGGNIAGPNGSANQGRALAPAQSPEQGSETADLREDDEDPLSEELVDLEERNNGSSNDGSIDDGYDDILE